MDDPCEDELSVFSGNDLLLAHYDVSDLDWEEIAERSLIDERRGLIIAQVSTLEDLLTEFLLYLSDADFGSSTHDDVERLMFGARAQRFRSSLDDDGLLDDTASALADELDAVIARRNTIAHGFLHWQPVAAPVVPIRELLDRDLEMAWILTDRRRGTSEQVSMAGLREDLRRAAGLFMALLRFAEHFVERAPRPSTFPGGVYLGRPTP